MITLIGLIVGIVFLVLFGWSAAKEASKRDFIDVGFSALVAFISIFAAGIFTETGKGQLLTGSAIADKSLYLLEPATNVICLIPAKLNGLTAVLESNGPPAYYAPVRMGTYYGPGVAIRNSDGEIVLKPFPLKMETERERPGGVAH